MHEQIYDKLKEVARAGTVTYYSDIAPMAGLDMELLNDRYKIGAMLDDINQHEREFGRPMLSAIEWRIRTLLCPDKDSLLWAELWAYLSEMTKINSTSRNCVKFMTIGHLTSRACPLPVNFASTGWRLT